MTYAFKSTMIRNSIRIAVIPNLSVNWTACKPRFALQRPVTSNAMHLI